MISPLISVDNITVRLRERWLLERSSWQFHAGETWAVVGPNGAGKTTFAKAVAGLLPVVQGKIHYYAFDGLPPQDAIAYVASDARRALWRRERLHDHARGFAGRFNEPTIVRQWLNPQHTHPTPPPTKIGFPSDLVAQFNLGGLMDKPLMALSSGEMSRLMVAQALARQPRMLILDEPFEGLDQPVRQELVRILDRLAVSGLPTMLITHRIEEMLPCTTHVLRIDNCQIVSAGPVVDPVPPPHGPAADAPRDEGTYASDSPPPDPEEKAPPIAASLIDMREVTVRYGDAIVLERLTWRVASGENWAITGPNGAGKSTILKLITGECLQVYANRIRLFGKDRGVKQTLWEARERLGLVSHDLAIAYQKRMSAMDVVCSGFFDSVGLYRNCDPTQRDTAAEWLAKLELSPLAGTPFNRLSQGERQMVLIARAMVKAPQLLILDEPCAGLDADNRRRVLDAVSRIGRRKATDLLFVSHHESEVPDCTTHRLVLDGGRVVSSGPVDR